MEINNKILFVEDDYEIILWIETFLNEIKKKNSGFEIIDNQLYISNEKINLTKIEFYILKVLLYEKDQVVKREDILKKLDSISSDKTLEYHISNIRKKIGENGSKPKYLLTQYGVGYKLLV